MTEQSTTEIREYKVYKHTLPNGKAYIGTTSAKKLYKRFNYGKGYANQDFSAEVADYGWSQVKTEILDELVGTYKDATAAEAYWIKKNLDAGVDLCNKHYVNKVQKVYKNNHDGCTIIDTNTYYETFTDAAKAIGVTPSAIRYALAHSGVCKGWNLAYGNVTKEEENDKKTEA